MKIRKNNNIRINKNKSVVSKKSKLSAEKYTHNLAKKIIFTHNYELQDKLKKQREEKEVQEEMSQCTFKPKLYKNKYNKKNKSKKKDEKKQSLYEKQSQWLDGIQKKKDNEREKRINQEIQGCTFYPRLTSLPKYTNRKMKITTRERIEEQNYYIKMKKVRQIEQEKNKKDELKEEERKIYYLIQSLVVVILLIKIKNL